MTDALTLESDSQTIAISGIEVKRVFSADFLTGTKVRVPQNCHSLPDFRHANQEASEQAMQGLAPSSCGLMRFNPRLGPFSLEAISASPWAQSLDFMRDIKSIKVGGVLLTVAWTQTWLDVQTRRSTQSKGLFWGQDHSSSKTERLIWRARRIQNCLSHVLPILHKLELAAQKAFWPVLLNDIAKLAAPSDGLWKQLTIGFDTLSPRAVWSRSITLLAVEASLPGFLRSDLIPQALDQVKQLIQSDGMFTGGSVIATLSAGADLCMLTRIVAIAPLLDKLRIALASLRRSDGSLVTFGDGLPDYTQLLSSVLGPSPWRSSPILVKSAIGRTQVDQTIVWLRAPVSGRNFGALLEIEDRGALLLGNVSHQVSGVQFRSPATITNSHCKRRDEANQVIMEATADVLVEGRKYNAMRHIKMSLNGRSIEGEDSVIASQASSPSGAESVVFAVPIGCRVSISKDKCSVLIVTSRQQAWRFRAEGMDIEVEIGSETATGLGAEKVSSVVVCRSLVPYGKSYYKAKWHFVAEDTE
jgi:Heparinase II/III-like protein